MCHHIFSKYIYLEMDGSQLCVSEVWHFASVQGIFFNISANEIGGNHNYAECWHMAVSIRHPHQTLANFTSHIDVTLGTTPNRTHRA